ncbi:MAG: putative quinol monooxygenase [Blastocatellia bacterium]
MISIIAKWTILEGKREQAIPALQDLAKQVEEGEPFVWMYTIHTPDLTVTNFPTPPANEVVFFSVFADHDAFEKHLNGPIFQNWFKQHSSLFLLNNGNLFVISEFLDRQAGYVHKEMLTTPC